MLTQDFIDLSSYGGNNLLNLAGFEPYVREPRITALLRSKNLIYVIGAREDGKAEDYIMTSTSLVVKKAFKNGDKITISYKARLCDTDMLNGVAATSYVRVFDENGTSLGGNINIPISTTEIEVSRTFTIQNDTKGLRVQLYALNCPTSAPHTGWYVVYKDLRINKGGEDLSIEPYMGYDARLGDEIEGNMFSSNSKSLYYNFGQLSAPLETFNLSAGRKYFIAGDISADIQSTSYSIDDISLYIGDTLVKSHLSPQRNTRYPFYGIYIPSEDETVEVKVSVVPSSNTLAMARCNNLIFADITKE